MALCRVTGTVYLPNGVVAANRTIVFRRVLRVITSEYLGAVLPDDVSVTTSAAGAIDVELLTGNYVAFSHVPQKAYFGSVAVPDAPTADIGDILDAAPVPALPPVWYQQALNARDEAVEAADDAASSERDAASSAEAALQAKSDAETLVDAAGPVAGFYDTIAIGLSSVGDGDQFGVFAGGTDGLFRATVYERISASEYSFVRGVVTPYEMDAEVSAREALGRQVVSVSEVSAAALANAPGDWGMIIANADGYILAGLLDGAWVPATELPDGLLDDVENASADAEAALDLAVQTDDRTQGITQDAEAPGFEDWSFIINNSDGYVLGGLRNGVWLPESGGGGSNLVAQLDARNISRSRAIQETPILGVQLPVIGWNIAINYGQSLAEGETTAPSLSRVNIPGTYMMGDNVDNITPPSTSAIPYGVMGTLQLNPLIARTQSRGSSPEYNLSDAEEAALPFGAVNRGEVPVVALANGVRRFLDRAAMGDSERNIIAISPAFAARNVSALSKGTSLYGVLIDGLQKARTLALAEGGQIVVPIIHYLQGEQDYSLTATPDNTRILYNQRLNQLFDDLSVDIMAITGQAQPPLFLFGQTTKQWTVETDANGMAGLSVGMAQIDTAVSRDDAVMVGPTYPYTNTGGHLDSNGSRWYGCHAAKVARRIMQGKGHQPTRIIEVRRETPNSILVSFHVPVPPLRFNYPYNVSGVAQNRADRGFRITSPDRATVYPVSSVEIIGQTIIRVTSSASIPDDVIVWLAGRDGGVVGITNICDSDQEVAFDRYEYLPERGMTSDRSHPELDNNFYPLENWSCAFSGSIGYTEF